MYSHDNFGLSYNSRNLKIASYLSNYLPHCSTLFLTDLSIIGRFKLPKNLDYVHLPGIVKQPNLPHQSRSLNIELTETLKIRRKMVQSIAKTFKPDAVLIAQDPLDFQMK